MAGIFSPAALTHYTQPVAVVDTAARTASIGRTPYIALAAGQAADFATTAYNIQRGQREGNPLFGGSALLPLALFKSIIGIVGTVTMRDLEQSGHPRAARILGYSIGAAGAVPAVHNYLTRPQDGR